MPKLKSHNSIRVYANWAGLDGPQLMGTLNSERTRGNEVFSFEYTQAWLESEYAQIIDPDLQLFRGRQYLGDDNKSNFGVFTDSSPDRWGRVLMLRREAALARREGRPVQNLFETDYLLGVYDEHRQGGLRFKLEENEPYLNNDREFAAPPWTSIRELEQISLQLEEDDAIDHPDYLAWLNMLIAPGSSLGGARPKASVIDNNGHLWIAKFPSRLDRGNIGGWEWVTYLMACKAGVEMAEAQVQKFASPHHTFITKRFDRTEEGERLHFASAMTLLGYTDGHNAEAGASYLELAEFISTYGANVEANLHQLWRRIVFSMCVSNTDDHLRNHGFILSPTGWELSPAYDINPVETGYGLNLNVSEEDNAIDLELAKSVAPYFRLKPADAEEIIVEVMAAVRPWRDLATTIGISRAEIEIKANAFRLVNS